MQRSPTATRLGGGGRRTPDPVAGRGERGGAPGSKVGPVSTRNFIPVLPYSYSLTPGRGSSCWTGSVPGAGAGPMGCWGGATPGGVVPAARAGATGAPCCSARAASGAVARGCAWERPQGARQAGRQRTHAYTIRSVRGPRQSADAVQKMRTRRQHGRERADPDRTRGKEAGQAGTRPGGRRARQLHCRAGRRRGAPGRKPKARPKGDRETTAKRMT